MTHDAATAPGRPVPVKDTAAKPQRRTRIRIGWFSAALLIVGLLTVIRVIVLTANGLNLGPDEAQYWSWSKDFAFGYFSKPPMLAWLIGASTAVCGEGEACIRLTSPLLHAGTSMALFLAGRAMFSARAGFWAAVTFATVPAVWFSAGIASTDVPLLFFWSFGLFFLWKTVETRTVAWAAATGLAIGLGFLSKYAMLYFVIGMALVLLTDRQARKALIGLNGAVILLLAGGLLAPNILWNLSNDFATLSHTAANASWGGALFNPDKLLKFIGDQFGVFGPVLFASLLWGLVTLRSRLGASDNARAVVFLLAFALPPLLIVSGQAFISRANANWAATAYAAATLLVVAWLLRSKVNWLLPVSATLHTILGLLFYAMVVSPELVEAMGRSNDFKRVRGWDVIGREVHAQAALGHDGRPYTAVLVKDRLVFGEMLYYARPLAAPLKMWDANNLPENHFELNDPLTRDSGRLVLFVTRSKDPSKVLSAFRHVTEIGRMSTEIGGGRTRDFTFYALDTYLPGRRL